jgi:diamine N-acetyltransferase
MPSLPSCRLATLSDASALAALASETFLHTWRELVPDADRVTYAAATFTPTALQADLERPAVFYLVLESETGELGGYARLSVGAAPPAPLTLPQPALLDRFYLRATWHGTGAAQQLLEEVIAHALRHKVATLWLCHHPSNLRAERFYARQGFTETAVGLPFVLADRTYHDVVLVRPLR